MTDLSPGYPTTFQIDANGSPIPDEVQVLSIQVDQPINGVSSAVIVVLDGDATTGAFSFSSSSTFVPGNEIEIGAGYDGKNSIIFKGIVTQQTLVIDETSGSVLKIACADPAVKMTVGRNRARYSNTTDSEAISGLIASYAGLTADVSKTTTVLPCLTQNFMTDWNFMLERADINGLVVSTLNGKVGVFKPCADTEPVLTISYGDNLFGMCANLDATNQYAVVKASAPSDQDQNKISAKASNTRAGPGNLSSKKLAEVIGLPTYDVETTTPMGKDSLSAWAEAVVQGSELGKITGTAKTKGTSNIAPGNYVSLEGLGDRFNGDHFVGSVRHTIADGNWVTDVGIGWQGS